MKESIILTGMPGSGKSVIGVLLARCLGLHFTDTDILIQENTSRMLQDILDNEGVETFLRIEEQTLLTIPPAPAVISTGGSAVYSAKAMEHLKSLGRTVYLSLPCAEVESRLHNITTRGIVMKPGQTISSLCVERTVLYEYYADLTVHCSGQTIEETLENVLAVLGKAGACRE